MSLGSSLKSFGRHLRRGKAGFGKDPQVTVRVVLGFLLAANIVAALVLFKPWGGSPEELEQQLGQLRRQVRQSQTTVERLRTVVSKVQKARTEGDAFLGEYFMDRRTASSTIISELGTSAEEAGIKQREHTFTFAPIEGSDTLSMMTISGNYEGAYAGLVGFLNLLDRSPRFLILDTLTAAPERTAGFLNVNFRMNAFTSRRREQPGGGREEETASEQREDSSREGEGK